jgi:REP element-mobilizing transposase RayT
MSRTRYKIFENEYPHFLTCTIVGWLPVFTRSDAAQIILNSWKFLQENGRLNLFGYVVLENHVHLVAAADDLSKEIGDFKSYTARQIIDLLECRGEKSVLQQLQEFKAHHKTDRTYQLWQEGSHPQQIQDDRMMRQKLDYIHYNPVRRGYVDDPVHWRYSSARNYAGLAGLLPVTTDWA